MKKILLLICLLLLSGCTLANTPETGTSINALTNAQTLELRSNNLKKVPNYIFDLANLEELNLSNNEISGAIQAEIHNLKKLKILDLSNNKMTGVPAEIGQLKNLEILNLSNNLLTGLPHELGNLQNLKELNLSGNNYSQQDLDIILKKLPKEITIIK